MAFRASARRRVNGLALMPTPSKVLYISHVAEIGGAEVALLDLVRLVDRSRVTPLVAWPGAGSLGAALGQLGVSARVIPPFRLKRSISPIRVAAAAAGVMRAAGAIAEIVRAESVSLIHANGSSACVGAALAACWTGVPLVWHCRDLRRPVGVLRWAARRAASIIAISDCVAARLRDAGLGAKVRVIPNGVDVGVYAPSANDAPERARVRTEWRVAPGQTLVGVVAHLVPWKRHDLFIEAAALAAREDSRLSFVVVGDDIMGDHPGYRARLLASVERLGLRSRLVFVGQRRDMSAVYAALDMLVHPPEAEPFGRALAEAMACGKPVIAIDEAGPGEIVESGASGLLVEAGDASALATAMRSIARDPALAARLGQGARARIVDRFNATRVARAVEALYAEVLSQP